MGELWMVAVAQPGRAPDCGSGCRGFKSRRSPHPSAGLSFPQRRWIGSHRARKEISPAGDGPGIIWKRDFRMKGQATNLTAAELKAIEEHKYYLSQQRGTEVSIEEAIDDFVQHFAEDWRKEKLRRDNLEQRVEIEKHKYLRSMAEGRDIGGSSAAEEWCQKYAHIWRTERESLQRNGFKRALVTVHNEDGLHLRPVSVVASLVAKFDCDVYVHK